MDYQMLGAFTAIPKEPQLLNEEPYLCLTEISG